MEKKREDKFRRESLQQGSGNFGPRTQLNRFDRINKLAKMMVKDGYHYNTTRPQILKFCEDNFNQLRFMSLEMEEFNLFYYLLGSRLEMRGLTEEIIDQEIEKLRPLAEQLFAD